MWSTEINITPRQENVYFYGSNIKRKKIKKEITRVCKVYTKYISSPIAGE